LVLRIGTLAKAQPTVKKVEALKTKEAKQHDDFVKAARELGVERRHLRQDAEAGGEGATAGPEAEADGAASAEEALTGHQSTLILWPGKYVPWRVYRSP
jgi:hypothetical protein